ncbi:hypothetical protein PILCRDRAFT_816009 [Piloderma croceum F 1598]|uniref:Uncharacterized protein n=1 Tax=Piloderma croceum (strain F 1598) TaxID=765440 RepID=A0A0C3G4M1_PILCF|nr:hypothetical protein PILCRDRAFT_816009 [Piloderma croceum F 1598]
MIPTTCIQDNYDVFKDTVTLHADHRKVNGGTIKIRWSQQSVYVVGLKACTLVHRSCLEGRELPGQGE